MATFWEELKRRKVVRVAITYAVVSWLLIQIADVVINNIGAPRWVFQTILLLLVVGFPVAIIIAWAFQLTPDGLKKEEFNGPSKQRLPVFAIILATLAFGSAALWLQMGGREISPINATQDSATARQTNPMLAILPFTNMSSSPENEYIADGMTEDIITLLAQSPSVEVIARNSTFKYKNQSPDVRDVGRDLGADYVVEGSIRPIGERIRVTVQVIETSSGSHIWAEQYDRTMTEFFDVQDEVSIGVAAAVGDAVFREEYNAINQSRTDNLTAWMLASRADVDFNLGTPTSESTIELARAAVAIDPEFALAHAVLGRSLAIVSLSFGWPDLETLRPGATSYRAEAEAEARLAARLAPDDPKVLAFQAITLLWTGHPEEALSIAERVTRISPSYAEGLAYYADILIHNGRSQESIPYFDKAIRLTPDAPQLGFYHFLLGEALMHHGNFEAAEDALNIAKRTFHDGSAVVLHHLAGTQLMLGKADEAKLTLEESVGSETLSAENLQRMMDFYSTDGGGEYFKSIWIELENL
jgi:TolB-like protein/Flp pilus assembly protein TadD